MAAARGRPTVLTPEITAAVCALVEETACSVYTAAVSLGIPWQYLYRWEQWGREGKQPFAEFCANVMQARAKAELELVRELRALAKTGESSRGLEWLLERRYPADYGNHIKVEQSIETLTDDELQAERALLRSRALDAPGSGGRAAPALPEAFEPDDESDELSG